MLAAKLLEQPVSKFGDLASLRAQGVTLVALCQDDFGSYDVKTLRPKSGTEETYWKIGALYHSLRQGRTPLWKRGKSLVTYLHPGLEVYDLPEDGK